MDKQPENADPRFFSIEDKAWAAGFIDGEGSVGLYRRRETHRHEEFYVRLSAVNTVIAPLEKLQLMFGGTIHPNSTRPSHQVHWKDSWIWVCSHRLAENALRALLPYFIVKVPQAENALAARALVSTKGKRRTAILTGQLNDLAERSKALNKKGNGLAISDS